jgi:hypothetical protein
MMVYCTLESLLTLRVEDDGFRGYVIADEIIFIDS